MQTRNTGTILLAVAFLGLLAWNVVGAPPLRPNPAQSELAVVGSISVSGTSAIRVQPDRAVVILGVETFAETPAQSQSLNAGRTVRVRQAIRSLGIPDQEIATANFAIYPEYEDWDRHDLIRGYVTSNDIAVTVRDVTLLEKVLVQALESGATSVGGIQFTVDNLRELRDEARALAVQAALEKAGDMAEVAGLTIANVTSIHENTWNYYGGISRSWTATQNVVQNTGGESALLLEDGSISLGKIVVQAEVSVSVQLRPAAVEP